MSDRAIEFIVDGFDQGDHFTVLETLAHRLTHQRHDRNTRHHPATQPGEPFAAQTEQVGAVRGRYQWNVLPAQRTDQSLGQEPMRVDHLRMEFTQRLA